MPLKKLFIISFTGAALIVLLGTSACSLADDANKSASPTNTSATVESALRTIITPQGELTIDSVSVKPHENNPEKKWVSVILTPVDKEPATAEAVYNGVEREGILIIGDDGTGITATSLAQSGTSLQLGFIIPATSDEYSLLWPDNDEVPLQDLAG